VKARSLAAWVLAAVLTCATAPGCDQFGNTKVAQGQRYSSGDSRFDPYFDSVHQQQVAAASWPDEKKATRRPLVNALALTPDAPDDTIVQATRERAKKLGGQGAKLDLAGPRVTATAGATSDAALFAAIEETARAEQERARRMKATSDKLEEMAKHGEALKKDAEKDLQNRGAEKADEQKMEHRREVRSELGGAIESMRALSRDATHETREIDEFLGDLATALGQKDSPPRRRTERKRAVTATPVVAPAAKPEPAKEDPPKSDEPKAKPKKADAPKKPSGKPAAPAGEKPAPAQPAQKPPDEVFSP